MILKIMGVTPTKNPVNWRDFIEPYYKTTVQNQQMCEFGQDCTALAYKRQTGRHIYRGYLIEPSPMGGPKVEHISPL